MLLKMEDIEDMFKGDDADDQQRIVKTKVRRHRKKAAETDEVEVDEVQADLPGKQNIYVRTYGCSHNISDSEYMAGLLADYGFKIVDDIQSAHACLLNSCTVKNPS